MLPRLLAWVLLQALIMGALHVGLAKRTPFPHVLFCALSGAFFAGLGAALLGAPLLGHARLAAWTTLWIPAFALGSFTAGLVLGAIWLGVVLGGGWWLRRRLAK